MSLSCSPKCANRPQTSSPATHQDHLETGQSSVMDIPQPEAGNNLPWQRKEPLDDNESGRLTPTKGRPASSSPWPCSRRPQTGDKWTNAASHRIPQRRNPAQREKAQDRCKDPNRVEQLITRSPVFGRLWQLLSTCQQTGKEPFHLKNLKNPVNLWRETLKPSACSQSWSPNTDSAML